MYLSVIIPAFNEEQRIEATLRSVNAYLGKERFDYEILVVNDGSRDDTGGVVARLAHEIPHLRLINNAENHGKGWVVRMGMLSARGRFRLFMDADNSTDISNIDRLFAEAEAGADVVVGSRRVPGAHIEVRQNWLRDFLGGAFRTLVSLVVPTGVRDTQNGFKLFDARAAEEIFRRQRTFTWAFDVEVLAIARMLHLSVREVPITWVNDGRSHVTFGGMVRMLKEVFEIKFNLLTHAYAERVAEEIRVG